MENPTLKEAIEHLEPLAERWEETKVWHKPYQGQPYFKVGEIEFTTEDLCHLAVLLRSCQKLLQPSTLIMVLEVDDPYMGDYPVAVCTSREKAVELFPKSLWEKKEKQGKSWLWVNLVTKETKLVRDDLNRPHPYVDVVQVDAEYAPVVDEDD